jgi:LysR family transcriptional regulator, transcriptional activator of nhaA
MIPFNYHHLYYFYVIAKTGSIAKACESLLLAQPTVSAQLKQFEKFLGRPLFDRINQRLSLTDDGRLVLDYAESIFELGREMQDALRDRPPGGTLALQVGVLSGTPGAFGQALLEFVLKAAPSAHVTVHEDDLEDLLEDLRNQKLDILLTDENIRSGEQEEFINRLVGKIPVAFAATPAMARRYKKFPEDLNGAPFILPSFPSQIFHQVQDLFAQWKVRPKIVAEVRDVELARRLALSGHGIAPINVYALSAGLPAKGLTVLEASRSIGLQESVYLVTRRRKRPNPLAERLMKEFQLPKNAV